LHSIYLDNRLQKKKVEILSGCAYFRLRKSSTQPAAIANIAAIAAINNVFPNPPDWLPSFEVLESEAEFGVSFEVPEESAGCVGGLVGVGVLAEEPLFPPVLSLYVPGLSNIPLSRLAILPPLTLSIVP